MALTFYYGSGSTFAWKVWLTLEAKGIPYEFKQLHFDKNETRTPEFRAINPRGKVPTIVDKGFALWESNAILEYLEEKYPNPPLLPKNIEARARARRLMSEADNYLIPNMNELLDLVIYTEADKRDKAAIDKAREKTMEELVRLEMELKGNFLLGELSLADFAMFPHARMGPRIAERAPGFGIVRSAMPSKVGAWLDRIEALPYYQKTIPPHWKS
jgi:glutathione S-transferase